MPTLLILSVAGQPPLCLVKVFTQSLPMTLSLQRRPVSMFLIRVASLGPLRLRMSDLPNPILVTIIILCVL